MSLITRCPACGTMFKVVADQLKVSQGWVRCGHCVEVFDASQNLQARRSPTEAAAAENRPAVAPPYPVPPPAPAPVPAVQVAAPPPPLVPPPAPSPVPKGEPFVESQPAAVSRAVVAGPDVAASAKTPEWAPGASFADRSSHAGPRDAAAGSTHDDDYSDFDPMAWKQKMSAVPEPGAEFQVSRSPLSGDEVTEPIWEEPVAAGHEDIDSGFDAAADEKTAEEVAGEDVSFVRDARRKAFWRKPAVRIVLGFASFLLALVLLLQVVVQQRDSLAAFEPRIKPWLQTLCEPLRCQIAPLKQIEALVIDSSSFNKLGTDAYRLSFSIKNTGSVAVALPAMEVTLTDTQDQALVRRVLMPSQFGVTGTVLPAGSDVTGLVALQVAAPAQPASASTAPAAEIHVAGYRVLAFYP